MPKFNLLLDGFYESEVLPLPSQECVNWYRVISKNQGDISPVSLRGSSGLTQIQTTGTVKQINRGMHVKDGKPYFLNGEDLVRLDRGVDLLGNETFTHTSVGTIPGDGRVSMADNGTELMVLVPGGKGYIINETSGTPFVEITDAGFVANGAPQIVVFVDSYFVCSTDSKKFIRSDANQGTAWSALNVFTAESDPDDIVGLQVYNNKLYVLGSEVTEEFANNAGIFQRTGFFIDKGLFAKFSTIATNNSFMWIGGGTNESPAIWTLQGNTPVKISTTAIDTELQSFSLEQIQAAFAYSYAQEGAYFVGFSFPTRTFEFNTVTGKWNERKSTITNLEGLTETIRWRVNSLGAAYNMVLVGDSQDGRIGSVDPRAYCEYGAEIIRTCVTQPLTDMGNSLSIASLEPTFKAGAGTVDVLDPKIRMSTSKDLELFSDETERSIGSIGSRISRTIWNRLGRFPRFALFKFTMSDKVESEFIKLTARGRGGQSGN